VKFLMPRDVLQAVRSERVTGLSAVPPLWIHLAGIEWTSAVGQHLRYFARTGGRMPLDTLRNLRTKLPQTRTFLMYGLTEAFRATYLPPDEVDRRPDSIGKAIPNTEVLVLREDGTECKPNEPGELVQRGPLVALGYWNDPARTAERFRPLPSGIAGRDPGMALPEIAVYSGDTVRRDEDGFLYFIGRRDEMIKTSGYRVSPTEVEELLYASRLVTEAAAFGVPHPVLGQAIVCVVTQPPDMETDEAALWSACRMNSPTYMVPAHIEVRAKALPRNQNGKIDRKGLAAEFRSLFQITQ
jgi:acyl-CoA synthetase (AMP-forming)/AMP-acid ligase II